MKSHFLQPKTNQRHHQTIGCPPRLVLKYLINSVCDLQMDSAFDSLMDSAFDLSDHLSTQYINVIDRIYTSSRLRDSELRALHSKVLKANTKYTFSSSFEVYSFLLGMLVVYQIRPLHYLSWNSGISQEDLITFSTHAHRINSLQ